MWAHQDSSPLCPTPLCSCSRAAWLSSTKNSWLDPDNLRRKGAFVHQQMRSMSWGWFLADPFGSDLPGSWWPGNEF